MLTNTAQRESARLIGKFSFPATSLPLFLSAWQPLFPSALLSSCSPPCRYVHLAPCAKQPTSYVSYAVAAETAAALANLVAEGA